MFSSSYQILRKIKTRAIGVSNMSSFVTIGDISVPVSTPKTPHLVPSSINLQYESCQELLHHMRWIAQKSKLGQDIFLVGPPGPLRRHLILSYAELCGLEVLTFIYPRWSMFTRSTLTNYLCRLNWWQSHKILLKQTWSNGARFSETQWSSRISHPYEQHWTGEF